MILQTQIPLSRQPDNHIDYQSKLVLLGSCFAENIAEKFEYYKFQTTFNPFEIIFNPLSIEKLLSKSIQKDYFTEADVFYHNEQWHCYDVHSKLSHSSKEELLIQLNNQTVANCHKVPQNYFTKVLLSIEDISQSLCSIVENVLRINPKAKFIFTVSPVRHIKDGFVENTQSKAHLISAIHQFLNQLSSINNQQSFYFPSYELLMDELRDYRFYTDDMLHPNQIAINYIWEKFNDVWIHSKAYKTMGIVESIQKGLQHQPFNPETQTHQQFVKTLEANQIALQNQFPHMVF